MPDHPGFELKQIDDRSIVRLRVRPHGADAAGQALHLPAALRWQGDDPTAYWLGPDRWLLSSDSKPAKDLIDQINSTLAGQLHAATDLSSSYVCLALSGPAARTILAMGCGIDLHASVFTTGQCVSTHFANILLFIVAVKGNHFDLYLDRSYARYLCDWLRNSGEDPITRDPKTLGISER